MNFLWLIVGLLTHFSRSTIENVADLRNGLWYAKNEDPVVQGSVNVNGSPSVTTSPLSKLHQESSTQNFPNGGSQTVVPTRIQPKLLDVSSLVIEKSAHYLLINLLHIEGTPKRKFAPESRKKSKSK